MADYTFLVDVTIHQRLRVSFNEDVLDGGTVGDAVHEFATSPEAWPEYALVVSEDRDVDLVMDQAQ